ncbi:sulfatase family protein [Kriegella aquimaris]|uniref:Arylsulfatase A n=1 Tax=Kriegella aquimaris TaxID=192904 RepID=A0A1G9V3T6_9FLAO|nr:sulfatase [Kriegella aquimaris]SDM66891.1 Arylsulfatase A [Kriegella aquimaris]
MKRLNISFVLFIFASLVFGYTQGQSGTVMNEAPNIIVFMADDVSWNDLGCYGNTFVDTPNIDKLAANGMGFDNAVLTASSCSPSRISIMTGRYPHNTGAAELHTEPKVDFGSIASSLKANGYYTGQAGKWHMGSLLRKGFDKIYEKKEDNGDGGENMWVPSIENRDKNKPFFFWFAAYDAHRIWGENSFSNTHEPSRIGVPPTLVDNDSTRYDLAQYYDEIKRFDHHIGKVVETLKAQGVYENTLIFVMADNGRPFPRDKTRMYDSGMKTPFIAHWPARSLKGASNSLISSVDLAPTILDACDVAVPKTFQGKSFKRLFEDPSKEFRTYAFAEHNWHDHEAHERMARTKDFIYILNSRPQFPNQGPADALNSPTFRSLQEQNKNNSLTGAQYDVFLAPRPAEELYSVKNDPLQLDNIIDRKDYVAVQKELKRELQNWMEKTGDEIPGNLTKDWYTRDGGKKIGKNFNIRGEMPGVQNGGERRNTINGFND